MNRLTNLTKLKSLLCLLGFVAGCLQLSYGQVSVFPATGGDQRFRIGGLSFSFPTPDRKLAEPGSDLRVLFEPLAPATNRLVAAFVLSDELRSTSAGTTPALTEYALIEVPRRAEFISADSDAFRQVADAVGKQFEGDLSGTVQKQQDSLNSHLKELGSKSSVTLDKPLMLGKLFSNPDAIGYGMIMPYSSNGVTIQVAMALNVIRAHNRVVFAYFYTPYVDENTVMSLKITDEEWADAILKANQ